MPFLDNPPIMSTKPATKRPSSASKKNTTVAPKKTKKSAEVKENVDATPTEKKERKRREVSKESVDTDFSKLQARIEEEITRLRDVQEKVKGIKFLRSINKSLKVLHSDTKRVMKLKKKTQRKKTVVSGFLKPIKISPELAAFTQWDAEGTYSRVNVTKFICDYIKTNSLFDAKDKRKILCDDKLKNLLKYDPNNPGVDKKGEPATLNYFRLQKYLKPHFIKIEDKDKPEEVSEEKSVKKAATPPAPQVVAAAPSKKAAAPKKVAVVKKTTAVKVEEDDDDAEVEDD